MKHHIMLEVMEQRGGHAVARAGHEHRGVGNASCRTGRLDEHLKRQRVGIHPLDHQLAPLGPGRQQREGDRADQQRKPAAGKELGQVGGEVEAIDEQERTNDADDQRQRPIPDLARKKAEVERGDEHRASHGDTVSGGQIGRLAEAQHEQDNEYHQRPVHERDVDLAKRSLACVGDAQARHQAELDCLLDDRKGAGDDRLAGDDGRDGREDYQWQAEAVAGHVVEGVLGGGRVGEQQCGLTEIVGDQRREDQPQPRQRNRTAAEVAHVGIERFGTGDAQHDRTQRKKGERRIVGNEANRPDRVQRE